MVMLPTSPEYAYANLKQPVLTAGGDGNVADVAAAGLGAEVFAVVVT